MKKKAIIAVSAIALVLVLAIGGTVAWLTSETDPVTNTFTYGDINISLWEHTLNSDGLTLSNTVTYESQSGFKIIPGNDIAKDPTVTVKSGSEPCYLFVKVEEANWPIQRTDDNSTRKIDYAVAEGWTALKDNAGVYYREVAAVNSDTSYGVLADNKIIVSSELTKDEVTELKNAANAPTLTFTAYAVQRDSKKADIDTAAEAWSIINSSTT